MDILYQIKFHNNWHCGSGLSAGADVDLLVIKDKWQLPFVPGKTIKGLVKEAMTDILTFKNYKNKAEILNILFGKENDAKTDNELDFNGNTGKLFFTNSKLDSATAEKILEYGLSSHLYRSISTTAIDEDGIAKKHSLRRIEVTIPCSLCGEIKNVPDEHIPLMKESLRYIKRLGQNRNRGLGRCDIFIIKVKEGGIK